MLHVALSTLLTVVFCVLFLSSPTTLDAVVFAHLAVIWKAPLPNNKLFNYLQGYDNLCMFCGRILQRYFPQAQQEGKKYGRFEQQDVQSDTSSETLGQLVGARGKNRQRKVEANFFSLPPLTAPGSPSMNLTGCLLIAYCKR